MKKTFLGLTLAAAVLSAAATATAEDNAKAYDGNGPVTPVAYIGDMPSHSEEAYFAENADAAAKATKAISQTGHTSRQAQQRRQPSPPVAAQPQQRMTQSRSAINQQVVPAARPMVRPGVRYSLASAQQMQPGYDIGFQPEACNSCQSGACGPVCGCETCQSGTCGPVCGCETCCDTGYCDSGYCDSGCDSGCGGGGCALASMKGMNMAGMFGMCDSSGWFRYEALLWFAENRELPSLVTASRAGTLPIIGLPTTQTIFGNEVGGDDLLIGYRGDVGRYIGDNIGVGARFWLIDESHDQIALAGDGSDFSIGRPFYDDDSNINNALLVAVDPGAADIEGAVAAETKLNVMAAEAYGRLNLTCDKTCQLDLIGGYTYYKVDDVTRVVSASRTATSERTFSDVFDCENRFNGGQIGFESVIKRGKFIARGLTKIHLGNMNQRTRIGGRSIEDFLDPFVDPTVANSGLLTMGNQGDFQRDIFTFVPEMNLKLSYRPRNHLEVSAGYSLVYFDRVALSGINIDPTIDPAFLNTDGPFPLRPRFSFQDTSLWVQGVDLGVAITY